MTDENESEAALEKGFIEYLQAHPDLLTRYPHVLELIEVPHRCGSAVSLVEHQVMALKESNRRLRRKLRELVHNATSNQERVQRLLELSLSLLGCGRMSDLVTRLYRALNDDFQVDVARMRLFGDSATYPQAAGVVFVDMDEQTRDLFTPVLSSGAPVCGRLRAAQLNYLFGDQCEAIGSSALLPLGPDGHLGLLAMGSHDPQRFHPAQGTEFLQKMGELVSRAVSTHLEAA